MQTKNPIFDDIAGVMTGAAGIMAGASEEVRTALRARTDKLIADMDLVGREEFDLVKEMAGKALLENQALREEITALKLTMQKTKKIRTRKTGGVK